MTLQGKRIFWFFFFLLIILAAFVVPFVFFPELPKIRTGAGVFDVFKLLTHNENNGKLALEG